MNANQMNCVVEVKNIIKIKYFLINHISLLYYSNFINLVSPKIQEVTLYRSKNFTIKIGANVPIMEERIKTIIILSIAKCLKIVLNGPVKYRCNIYIPKE